MAEICVKAVIAVADLERKDVNLELIKVGVFMYIMGRGHRIMLSPCCLITRAEEHDGVSAEACMIRSTHTLSFIFWMQGRHSM